MATQPTRQHSPGRTIGVTAFAKAPNEFEAVPERSVPLTVSALLAEAFRFYNAKADGITTGWEPLTSDRLILHVPAARFGLHDSMLGRLSRLVDRGTLASTVATSDLSTPRKGEGKESLVDFIRIGRLIADTLGSGAHRSAKAPDQWNTAIMMIRNMTALLSPTNITDAFEGSFGALARLVSGQCGSKVHVREQGVDAFPDDGLTEHLYAAIRHPWLAHIPDVALGNSVPGLDGRKSFGIQVQVRDDVATLFGCLGITRRVRDLQWLFEIFDNLDALERRFQSALVPADGNFLARSLAIRLGLGWGLVLTATMRAFLAEAVARLQLAALPFDVMYREHDSLTVIALIESITTKEIPSLAAPGYYLPELTKVDVRIETDFLFPGGRARPDERNLIPLKQGTPLLENLHAGALADRWGTGSCPDAHHFALLIDRLKARPVIQARPYALALKKWRESGSKDLFADERCTQSLTEVTATLPRLPTAVRLPRMRFPYDQKGIELYMCAEYEAQLQLYVCAEVLQVATNELGLAQPWRKDGISTKKKQHRACPACGHISNRKPGVALPEQCDDGTVSRLGLPPELGMTDVNDALPSESDIRKWTPGDASAGATQRKWLDRWNRWKVRPTPDEPSLMSLQLLAAAFPWGGAMPPHRLHKDGRTFDIRFGADAQEWPLPAPFNREMNRGFIPVRWPAIAREIAAFQAEHTPLRELQLQAEIAEAWKSFEQATALLNADGYEVLGIDLTTPPESALKALRKAVRDSLGKGKNKPKPEVAKAAALVLDQVGILAEMVRRALSELIGVRLQGRVPVVPLPSSSHVFRGIVRDILDRRQDAFLTAARAGDFRSSAQSAAWEVPETLRLAEREMLGTPHHESEAGRQWAAIAHVAVLLSSPRQVLYASPITHFRSVTEILTALSTVADSEDVFTFVARDVIGNARFIFMPHNHHDHWHVEYEQLNAKRREDLLWLWFELGVDLAPFLAHLKREEDTPDRRLARSKDPAIVASRERLVTLRTRVEDYQNKYAATYTTDERGLVRLVRARRRLYAILLRLNKGSAALHPTRPDAPSSAAIRQAMRLTEGIIGAARSAGATIPASLYAIPDGVVELGADGELPPIDEALVKARTIIELFAPEPAR